MDLLGVAFATHPCTSDTHEILIRRNLAGVSGYGNASRQDTCSCLESLAWPPGGTVTQLDPDRPVALETLAEEYGTLSRTDICWGLSLGFIADSGSVCLQSTG